VICGRLQRTFRRRFSHYSRFDILCAQYNILYRLRFCATSHRFLMPDTSRIILRRPLRFRKRCKQFLNYPAPRARRWVDRVPKKFPEIRERPQCAPAFAPRADGRCKGGQKQKQKSLPTHSKTIINIVLYVEARAMRSKWRVSDQTFRGIKCVFAVVV